jgi:hypothetical protein
MRRAQAALLAGVLLAGCGGGRFVNGAYLNEAKRFRVELPPGWVRIEMEGADLALRAPGGGVTLAVAASCPPAEEAEPPVLTRHLLFGLRQREFVRQEPVSLDGATGLKTQLRARAGAAGAAVLVEAVVVRRGNCLYDLLAVARPETSEGGAAGFEALLRGWQFLRGAP